MQCWCRLRNANFWRCCRRFMLQRQQASLALRLMRWMELPTAPPVWAALLLLRNARISWPFVYIKPPLPGTLFHASNHVVCCCLHSNMSWDCGARYERRQFRARTIRIGTTVCSSGLLDGRAGKRKEFPVWESATQTGHIYAGDGVAMVLLSCTIRYIIITSMIPAE